VVLLWSCSNSSMSFLCGGLQSWGHRTPGGVSSEQSRGAESPPLTWWHASFDALQDTDGFLGCGRVHIGGFSSTKVPYSNWQWEYHQKQSSAMQAIITWNTPGYRKLRIISNSIPLWTTKGFKLLLWNYETPESSNYSNWPWE